MLMNSTILNILPLADLIDNAENLMLETTLLYSVGLIFDKFFSLENIPFSWN